MINPTIPFAADQLMSVELPNGEFLRIDTRADANGLYKIDLLDRTALSMGINVIRETQRVNNYFVTRSNQVAA